MSTKEKSQLKIFKWEGIPDDSEYNGYIIIMANSLEVAREKYREWRDDMDAPYDNGYIGDYPGRAGSNTIFECEPDEIHEIDMSEAYIIGCRRG